MNSSLVIFLDIEGVLNSIKHKNFRQTPEGKERTQRLLANHQGAIAIDLIMLDEQCLKRLQEFVIVSHSVIVISSSCRIGKTSNYFETLFKLAGYELPNGSIIGCTPIIHHDLRYKRGHEINQWVADNKFHGKYVIIDDGDLSNFLPNQPLVKVDKSVGLQPCNIEQMKHVLNN